jgi:hypothetical protein
VNESSTPRTARLAPIPGRGVAWLTATFFLLFAAVIWIATRGPGALIDLFENGHWLGPASDMLAGKVPYRDTFPMHGFLSDGGRDYLVFRLFETSFRASVDARHLVESFFHPALFLVAAAASRRPLAAALAVPLNIGMSPAVVADRPVLPLLSLAAFAWALGEERSGPRAFLAGFLGALGLLYSLDFGTFVLAAQVATFAVCHFTWRKTQPCPFRMRPYFLGLAAVLVPWFAYLAWNGAFVQFLKVSFVDLPLRFESFWGLHFPAPWEVLGEWLEGRRYIVGIVSVGPGIAKRLYLAPALGGIGVALALWMRKRGISASLALRLLALSLACLAFYRHVTFRFHLNAGNALTGPVLFLLLVVAFEVYRARVRSPRRLAAVLASVGVLAAFGMNGPVRLLAVLRDATKYRERTAPPAWLAPLTVPRGGGIQVPREEQENLRALIEFTDRHAAPGASVLDLSNRGALYFYLRRVNPTRFAEVPPMAAFEDEILRDLRARPPALVFLESGSWLDAIDGIRNSQRIPRVWAWVLENYPVRAKVGDTVVALPPGKKNDVSPSAVPRSPPASAPRPAGRSLL